jgi:type III pantothenate kinase
MKLLIDSGNTRLKWSFFGDDGLINCHAFINEAVSRHTLIEAWKEQAPTCLAIASVSLTPLIALLTSVAMELWPTIEIVHVKSEAHAFGVYNAYTQPEKLGVDRWLALVAVHNHYQKAACIVDCGTAITVDLIDAEGKHQGGLISPGLTLMKQALSKKIKALPWQRLNYQAGIANSTESGIYGGTLAAAVGLIEHVFNQQPKDMLLILTGGDAVIIAEQLDIMPIIDIDLVLHGLVVILDKHR